MFLFLSKAINNVNYTINNSMSEWNWRLRAIRNLR